MFHEVDQPITHSTGHVFAPLASDSDEVRAACRALIGRPCAINAVANAKDAGGFHANVEDLAGIKALPNVKEYPPGMLEAMLKASAGPRPN